jgi:hypothetical protein
MSLLVVGLLFLSAHADAASASASASHAVAANQAVASPTQQVAEDSEPPQTPEQKAAAAAYQNYLRALVRSLSVSADARDRALAATQMLWLVDDALNDRESTADDRATRGAMLRDAAEKAPDDALVQWFWANASPEDSGCTASKPCPHRAEAIARLQPDNGSAWLPVFNAAWKANDIPAAESVLVQIARANHFDEQFGAAVKAWMDVYRRYPMPKSAMLTNSDDSKFDDQTRNLANSFAFAAASGISSYGSLMNACSQEKHPDASQSRFRNCAQVGRIMLTRATSLLANRIGSALLRVSGQATPSDIASARLATWRYEQWNALVRQREIYAAADLKAKASDWIETGDEMQVMRRELQRAGISLTPPADWQPRGRDGKPISPLGEAPAPAAAVTNLSIQ